MNILIVGAGFSGAVVANQLSKSKKVNKITVIDERNHIGGNCHTEKDSETGIIVHKYGPHIFHTSNLEVWKYINQFDEFVPYQHRVKANYNNQVYSLPINLHTINQFFNKDLNPKEAKKFIESISENISNPQNFEEQALAFIGKDLYYAFFYGYTKKQWGCEPKDIPASVMKRLPVRFTYDDTYHHSKFGGIPKNGYSYIINQLLSDEKIELYLNEKYQASINDTKEYDHIFYTGPIDGFFGYKFGRLGYRTVTFEEMRSEGDYQGCVQMNYTDEKVPFTRITEHKFFLPHQKDYSKTVSYKEFSKETNNNDIPYYPKRLKKDKEILNKYLEEKTTLKNYTFLGRLANYMYMDMHQVINDALTLSKYFINKI